MTPDALLYWLGVAYSGKKSADVTKMVDCKVMTGALTTGGWLRTVTRITRQPRDWLAALAVSYTSKLVPLGARSLKLQGAQPTYSTMP